MTAAVRAKGAKACVRSTRRGSSFRRNLGAALASGRWLFYLGDNAWVAAGWVDAVLSAVGDVSVDFAGGLLLDDRGCPAVGDRGTEPCDLAPATVWRCGRTALLVRARRFGDLGGFDERFGAGGRRSCAEETDLVPHLLARGGGARSATASAMARRSASTCAVRWERRWRRRRGGCRSIRCGV